MSQKPHNPLWTKDFTIITVGSVVSMFGNTLAGFAMSLMVLDYTGSTLMYAIYLACYTVPQIFMPLISGPILDRFSRKKMIYTLDFVSAALYLFLYVWLSNGLFSFPLFALYVMLEGSINSVYFVAYESFYPLLIPKGCYQKAYAISSVLETASAVMVPLATWLYNLVGISPLMLVNAVTFLAAALMETRITADEAYVRDRSQEPKRMLTDLKEGAQYLRKEPGLRALVFYYTVMSFTGSASLVVLPWFRNSFDQGEYLYMIVMGAGTVARMVMGLFHYKKAISANKRWNVALVLYISMALIEMTYLFLPIWAMAVMMFASGAMGITTYTIRASASQSYVPDGMKGRFNGIFTMLTTVGSLVGEVAAGALADHLPMRFVMVVFSAMNLLGIYFFVFRPKKDLSGLLNTVQ